MGETGYLVLKSIKISRDGGLAVSMLSFYSYDPSLNHAQVFSLCYMFGKNKNRQINNGPIFKRKQTLYCKQRKPT